jgi:hypothetical protein
MPRSERKPQNVGLGNTLPAAKKAAIIMSLASGASVREAATNHGVSVSTITSLQRDDAEFRDMLQEASDIAVNTILAEVQTNVRNQVRALGPKALDVLKQALDSKDGRVALQAAGIVLRGTGIMDGGKLEVRVGLESAVGTDTAFGD